MALNIDLDVLGFLSEDSHKASPTMKQESPNSPIESESSGISSLDSDDLKVRTLKHHKSED